MRDQNKYFEIIDDFLLGHLDPAAAEDFQQQMQKDPELAKAVDSQKRLQRGIIVGGRRALKEDLKAIHQEVVGSMPDSEPEKKINWRGYVVAAIIVFLALLAWWLWMPQKAEPQKLYAQYYQTFQPVLALRDSNTDPRINEVANLYRNGAYTEAIPLLEALLLQEEDNSQLLLTLAVARFETGDSSKVFSALQQIIDANDPFLSDQAKWYSALFHLQLQQVDQALPFLQSLADEASADKNQEAKKILDALK